MSAPSFPEPTRVLDPAAPSTVDDPDASRTTAGPTGGAPVDAPALPPGYESLGVLGRGGMGVVYHARQVAANRPVALKMILAGEYATTSELARFQAEAEAVAGLQHPNVVAVYEVGEVAGRPFFSMEFCPGGPLAGRLSGNPLPPGRRPTSPTPWPGPSPPPTPSASSTGT